MTILLSIKNMNVLELESSKKKYPLDIRKRIFDPYKQANSLYYTVLFLIYKTG